MYKLGNIRLRCIFAFKCSINICSFLVTHQGSQLLNGCIFSFSWINAPNSAQTSSNWTSVCVQAFSFRESGIYRSIYPPKIRFLSSVCLCLAWNEIHKNSISLHSVLPAGIRGGNDFCVISQARGQLLNFKSQGGDTFRGEDDFRQSSRGGTALSWRIVGISTKCFTLNFTNFACGAILYFSNFFTTHHTVHASIKHAIS